MHGVLVSVQVGELLLLDDLGDRAGGASVLASATGDAGILVSDGSDVLELQNASGQESTQTPQAMHSSASITG